MRRKTADEELFLLLEETKRHVLELKAKIDVLLEKLEEMEREFYKT